jgi:hypothetical protein
VVTMKRSVLAMAATWLAACASAPTAEPRAAAVEPTPPLPWCPPPPPGPERVAEVGAQQERPAGGGAVQGVVREKASLGGLADVTVVATSPALEGSASELTDATGQYLIDELPPGTYEVVFYYGELKARQTHVTVGEGKVTPLNLKLDTTAEPGTVVDITPKAPTIDGDFGPGPVDPNDPHGGRLWAGRRVSIGSDYTKDRPLAGKPATPRPCRPRLTKSPK